MTTQDASALATRLAEKKGIYPFHSDPAWLANIIYSGLEVAFRVGRLFNGAAFEFEDATKEEVTALLIPAIKNVTDRLAQSEEENQSLRALVGRMNGQMNKVRRFLPSHGSFGEEGISDYEQAIEEADKVAN